MINQIELFAPITAAWKPNETRILSAQIGSLEVEICISNSGGGFAVATRSNFHRPDSLGFGGPYLTRHGMTCAEAFIESLGFVRKWLRLNKEYQTLGLFESWALTVSPADLKPIKPPF